MIAFVVAIARAIGPKQRELAAALFLLGLGLVASVSALLGYPN